MKANWQLIQRWAGVEPDGIPGPATARAIIAKADIATPPFDKAAFFAAVRKITGPLDQVQVDSIEAILKRMAGMPVQHVAYVLATAWHEARFKPQREWGLGKGKRYGKPDARERPALGLPTYGGQIPYGRGLAQLTWVENYEWADKRLGLNGALLADFDLALRPAIAADVLVFGMLEAAFASNGKPLSHYGPKADGSFDYRHARQTVNRMDKADLIAGYAVRFEDALRQGGWG
jgi:putative chitinase